MFQIRFGWSLPDFDLSYPTRWHHVGLQSFRQSFEFWRNHWVGELRRLNTGGANSLCLFLQSIWPHTNALNHIHAIRPNAGNFSQICAMFFPYHIILNNAPGVEYPVFSLLGATLILLLIADGECQSRCFFVFRFFLHEAFNDWWAVLNFPLYSFLHRRIFQFMWTEVVPTFQNDSLCVGSVLHKCQREFLFLLL